MNSIFVECLGAIKDHRVDRTKKHLLLDIIALSLCGVIAGAQHWSLDVTFREDDCRIRDENAALNMSWLRKFSLGLLKNEISSIKKLSIRRKQLKAWADTSYLTRVLEQN